jgi:hypothetical protein
LKSIIAAVSSLFVLNAALLNAQPKTNLEVMHDLIERTVVKSGLLIGDGKKIGLSVATSQPLEIVKPAILKTFSGLGFIFAAKDLVPDAAVSYTLISSSVEYKNSFSEGFFGSLEMERAVQVRCSVTISKKGLTQPPVEFIETALDTIKLNEVSAVEDRSIPFSQAPIPSQPLISTFWEPILIVGTLIGTVILLFTVRSK